MTEPTKFTFIKPKEIFGAGRLGGNFDLTDEARFIDTRIAALEQDLDAHDFYMRKARITDIDEVLVLSKRAYSHCKTRDLVNAYDFYQSITYNYGLVICTKSDPEKIVGCFFNFVFHANGDKICNLKRLAIDPDFQKYGLGRILFEYNQLMARKTYGSRIQTGLIECSNYISVYLVLNKMGGVMDFITDDMTNHFLAYSFVIPLDMTNWGRMEVDQEQLANYLKGLKEDVDYIQFPYDDNGKLAEVMSNKNFKVTAALRKGKHAERDSLIAFSNEILNVELK